jgi:hypothetical protein
MDLRSKYKPILLSELEQDYPFKLYLDSKKSFIVNGSKGCGKSTITKLYLKTYNYDYLLIDDFNLPKDNIIDKIKYKTRSIYSFFYNKKYIILIDNFDLYDNFTKDFIINDTSNFQYVIITNKFLNVNINYIRINNYTYDYICDLYLIIYFLETNYNTVDIPNFENISEMFTILEFNLNTNNYNNNNNNNNYEIIFDKFNYTINELIKEKNFNKKIYILDKFDSYSVFQNNLIYNYDNIDELADIYDNLSSSMNFYNNLNNLPYYSICSIIGTSYKLDNFQIIKENFQIRKKKNLKIHYY